MGKVGKGRGWAKKERCEIVSQESKRENKENG